MVKSKLTGLHQHVSYYNRRKGCCIIDPGLCCQPEEWNSKKGEVKNNRLNGMLCEYKKRLDETYAELLKVNGVISAELLKTAMTGTADIPKYILQAGEVERENLKIRSIQIDSTSSYRQSKMYHYYLGEYIRSLGKEDMLFTDITEEFGINYILYLKTNYPHKPSYRNHCLCWLKRLVYLAVDNGILRYNPLDDIKYEKKAPAKLHVYKQEPASGDNEPSKTGSTTGTCKKNLYIFMFLRFGLR